MQNDYEEIEYTEDNLQHTDTQQEGESVEKARVLGLIFSSDFCFMQSPTSCRDDKSK